MIAPVSLSAPAPQTEREKLTAAARGFEAILLRQFLAAARKTDFGGGLFDSEATAKFREMQDENLADMASRTGAFGLAKVIEAQLARQVGLTTDGSK